MNRRTRIVATLGPATDPPEILDQLIRSGLDVARLNFSHGTHKEHADRIARVRAVARQAGRVVGILQDLQGPKIRVGALENDRLRLDTGGPAWLYPAGQTPPKKPGPLVPVDLPELFGAVKPGDQILLDDGRLGLRIVKVKGELIETQVENGGLLRSHKGINLPGVDLAIPGFTAKDAADLAFGLQQAVDAVAVSFVRSAADIESVRAAIAKHAPGRSPLVIAKLERPQALEHLDEILLAADGVMVARGDLGVEMPPERVPLAQKRIIQAAQAASKLVITATQMLDSMISQPLPTRAEASDVANAVFDGTDAVMLSAETAAGSYPVESLAMMERIVCEAEAGLGEWGHLVPRQFSGGDDALALAHAAREIAQDRDVTAIAVFTQMGRTAWLMSKTRPKVPILAFTPEEATCRQLTFLWGVEPQVVPFAGTMEKMLGHIESALTAAGRVKPGQQVVLVCGFPVGSMRPPNMALLHTLPE